MKKILGAEQLPPYFADVNKRDVMNFSVAQELCIVCMYRVTIQVVLEVVLKYL